MLRTISSLIGVPIMGLQTGTRLGATTAAIIDPRQLTVSAFYVEGPGLKTGDCVLHPSDIREISELGFIIDSDAKLMQTEGLVRLQTVIDLNFELIGLRVTDEDKRKLGKVAGYGVETDTFTVQQLYTEQSLFQSFTSSGHTIHRSQVVSVSNDGIVVKSSRISEGVRQAAPEQLSSMMNPFRKPSQPESSDNNQTSSR